MAIVFDAQGNLVDTTGRVDFSGEQFESALTQDVPDTADSPYANLLGLPATQDMGFLYGVPQRADDQGYLIGLPGTADDVFPFQPPGTADDRIANLSGVPGTADDVFPFAPKNRLVGLDLNRFQGINSLGVANEEDVEQVDYLGSKPNKFQEGIGKLFEFFQKFSPIAAIGRGIDSLRNRINTRKAIQRNIQNDPQGDIVTYDPAKTRNRQRIMNIQPTNQDRARGQIPSRTTTSAPRRSSSTYSAANRAFAKDR